MKSEASIRLRKSPVLWKPIFQPLSGMVYVNLLDGISVVQTTTILVPVIFAQTHPNDGVIGGDWLKRERNGIIVFPILGGSQSFPNKDCL